MLISTILFILAGVMYSITSVLYIDNLIKKNRGAVKAAFGMTLTGLLIHTAAIGFRCGTARYFPLSSIPETAFFFSWTIVFVFTTARFKARIDSFGAVILPLSVLILIIGGILPRNTTPLGKAFISPITIAHISASIIGYAAFSISFCAAIVYLIQHRMLKAKKFESSFKNLPPIDTIDIIGYHSVRIGILALTIGVVLGGLNAVRHGVIGWYLDPKAIISFITLFIYAGYLLIRTIGGWTGKKVNYLLIAGFVIIVFSYVGINTLEPGTHGSRFLKTKSAVTEPGDKIHR